MAFDRSRRVASRRHRHRSSQPAAAQPITEGLEERRLLAASPAVVTATLAPDGTLDVVGTRKADVIVLQLDAANPQQLLVTAGGVTVGEPLPLASVTTIRVTGGGGNDQITIGATLTLPATLLGDRGND